MNHIYVLTLLCLICSCICMFCRSLCALLAIVLSVLLRFTDFDYAFGIFKLFYSYSIFENAVKCQPVSTICLDNIRVYHYDILYTLFSAATKH